MQMLPSKACSCCTISALHGCMMPWNVFVRFWLMPILLLHVHYTFQGCGWIDHPAAYNLVGGVQYPLTVHVQLIVSSLP
jgi:hypothetical protein